MAFRPIRIQIPADSEYTPVRFGMKARQIRNEPDQTGKPALPNLDLNRFFVLARRCGRDEISRPVQECLDTSMRECRAHTISKPSASRVQKKVVAAAAGLIDAKLLHRKPGSRIQISSSFLG
jgi:hypothetical protein